MISSSFPEATAPSPLREESAFTTPRYEAEFGRRDLRLSVYLPGVAAESIEITLRGPDLFITGKRDLPVRVNFPAAHLEAALHDYRLHLRVGQGVDLSSLRARLAAGTLKLHLPLHTTLPQEDTLLKVA
jgi:HSP20 family protein